MSKQHNILIAHAPRTDYCENALFAYPENGYVSVVEQIDKYFGLQLYGDKHTSNVHNFDYIVGAPLDAERIAYGLHEFNDAGQYRHRTILYKNGSWYLIDSIDDVEDVLEMSKSSLKGQALKFLFDTNHDDNLTNNIRNFEIVKSEAVWGNLDQLFRAYATLQKPQPGMAGKSISTKDGIINTVSRLLTESEKQVSIILRGEARLGKSLFMTVLYLNLLYRFVSGTFDYMPLYIDLEKIMGKPSVFKSKDSIGYAKQIKKEIIDILKKGENFAKKNNCYICCMIDGLNQHVLYKNVKIERMIDDEINFGHYKYYVHFVYCIDTDSSLELEFTPHHMAKNAEYLVYFNRIRTNNVNSSSKYESFIKAFCSLNYYSEDDANQIMENMSNLELLEVDLNMLIAFGERLRIKGTQPFFDMLDEFTKDKLRTVDIESAAKASFYFYICGKNYTWIQKNARDAKISYVTFEVIRTQKLIARYLLAVNYVIEVQQAKDNIAGNKVLNYLYGHEICSYIRGYITKANLQSQLLSFARDNFVALSFSGKSTISFIVGRIGGVAAHDILNEENDMLLKMKPMFTDGDALYLFYIAKRSIRLSRIAVAQNKEKNYLVGEYIKILLSDKWERKINRDFYLQFYGDRTVREICTEETVIFEGFDIYNTFHFLASRIKNQFTSNKLHFLLPLELFTLCDLIQVRLDMPKAARRNTNEEVESFFYNERYNRAADSMANNILSSLLGIIDMYLDRSQSINKTDLFTQYLYHQKDVFQKFQQLLSAGETPDIESTVFNPRKLFAELTELEQVKKIGWDIREKTYDLTKNAYEAILNDTLQYETVLEHVYECYLIGLLYLPNKNCFNPEYSKQNVLNILLIHDIGEAYTGDYPPSYVGYKEKKEMESNCCKNIFLSGLHNDISDLTEYLSSWLDWEIQPVNNYNVRVAKDIDRIQMLYKLLVLLQKGKADFTKDRFKDFWRATDEGKNIFNLLIAADKGFVSIAHTYQVEVHTI